MDPYKVLGVNSTIPRKQLNRVYKSKMLIVHPDRNLDKTEEEQIEAEKKCKEYTAAWGMVGNGIITFCL